MNDCKKYLDDFGVDFWKDFNADFCCTPGFCEKDSLKQIYIWKAFLDGIRFADFTANDESTIEREMMYYEN